MGPVTATSSTESPDQDSPLRCGQADLAAEVTALRAEVAELRRRAEARLVTTATGEEDGGIADEAALVAAAGARLGLCGVSLSVPGPGWVVTGEWEGVAFAVSTRAGYLGVALRVVGAEPGQEQWEELFDSSFLNPEDGLALALWVLAQSPQAASARSALRPAPG